MSPILGWSNTALTTQENTNSDESRWEFLMVKIKTIEEVKSVAPYVMGQVLLQFGSEASRRSLMMMGVDSEETSLSQKIEEIVGSLDLSYQPEGESMGV